MPEQIVIVIGCLVVVAGILYYFYYKISSQQKIIDELIKRNKSIENFLTRPRPEDETRFVINRKRKHSKRECAHKPISEEENESGKVEVHQSDEE